MTDPAAPIEEGEYIPDPEKEKQAKAVHFTVSILRLLGIAIVMLGIAIALEKLPPVPSPVGYVLIAIGLFQTWVMPLMMVRRYVKARVAEEQLERVQGADSNEKADER